MKKGLLILSLVLLASVLVYGASGCSKQSAQSTGLGAGSAGPGAGSTEQGEQSGMPVPGSDVKDTGVVSGGNDAGTSSAKYTIEITSAGFSPNTLKVKIGDSVTFINKDSAKHWPASDVHPTHTLYPGTNIGTCFSGTEAEKAKMFDSCRALEQGESWSFTFNEKGKWGYHDHRAETLVGTIEVA
ncbi:MAG TPA: hypothetical protein HA250_01250 [Nanoarchaeota archaeon]|nr:MAG: hypothetical protein QT01_C0006G0020 [archaeon GW2011_AR6]HIH17997.1 hypothetical protein [Nanoarchaeota archaeon]HIH34462.1 hypothetical protein [Nanoarchaeota archaeon]HIH50966.1 hypothetical protein [Nanoarchaeota archaeon]